MKEPLHNIKTSLSLLKTYFSLLDDNRKSKEEMVEFMIKHVPECKRALGEIEDMVTALSKKAGEIG
jgi:predicted RNA-binding protein with EMAP domain